MGDGGGGLRILHSSRGYALFYILFELRWPLLSDTNLSGVVRRRTSTFSNRYFSYIFQWILLKLGTLISWVSPQTLFFSEFWHLDFVIFYEFSSKFIEIATAPTISDGFLWNYVHLLSLGQSSHLLLFIFFKFAFLYFLRIFLKFSLKSLLLLQYLMDSFEILAEKMTSVVDPAYNYH